MNAKSTPPAATGTPQSMLGRVACAPGAGVALVLVLTGNGPGCLVLPGSGDAALEADRADGASSEQTASLVKDVKPIPINIVSKSAGGAAVITRVLQLSEVISVEGLQAWGA